MAKVTRIDQGGIPSAVVNVPAPSMAPVRLLEGAGELFQQGAEFAAKTYAAEQKALAEALAKKREIVDTVSAGALSAEYEEDSRKLMGEVQKEFHDAPDKAPEAFLSRAQKLATDYQKRAENPEVELRAARSFMSQNQSSVREMGTWAQMRLTEQTKEKMVGRRNNLINSARSMSLPVLQATAAQMRMDPAWEAAYGRKAKDELALIESGMYNAYGEEQALTNPVGLLGALRTKGNVFAAKLKPEDYDSLEKKARMGIKGLTVTIRENELAAAAKSDQDLVNALQSGNAGASYTTAERNKIEAKRAATLNDPTIPEQARKETLTVLDRREKLLRTVEDIHYLNALRDRNVDDNFVPSEVTLAYERLNQKAAEGKKPTALDMAEFRQIVADAAKEGKMTRATASTYWKRIEARETALFEDSQENTGVTILGWDVLVDSEEAGNRVLNDLIQRTDIDDLRQRTVRLKYLQRLNLYEKENGESPDKKTSERFAREAYNSVVGR